VQGGPGKEPVQDSRVALLATGDMLAGWAEENKAFVVNAKPGPSYVRWGGTRLSGAPWLHTPVVLGWSPEPIVDMYTAVSKAADLALGGAQLIIYPLLQYNLVVVVDVGCSNGIPLAWSSKQKTSLPASAKERSKVMILDGDESATFLLDPKAPIHVGPGAKDPGQEMFPAPSLSDDDDDDDY